MKKKTVLAFGIACAVASAAFGGISWYIMNSVLHGKRLSLPEVYEWQQNRYDIGWYEHAKTEEYVIASYDGYELHATFVPNEKPSDRYVIFTHGNTDNRIGSLKFMKIFLDAGYSCICYDMRDHGENERSFCTYSILESQDLIAVIEDSYERFGEQSFLGLHGVSLGASVAIRSLMYQPRVNFVVADCGFADLENVLKNTVQTKHVPMLCLKGASKLAKLVCGYSFEEMRPIDALPGNTIPILFLHGGADQFVLPENSERMKEATAGYAELHLIPGGEHAESLLADTALYTELVQNFLTETEAENTTTE